MPVGGTKTVNVDVRVVAATNRDLEKEIAAGRFRQDLFFRLNVIPIHIPPLRERIDDMPVLVGISSASGTARRGATIRDSGRRRWSPDAVLVAGKRQGAGEPRGAPRRFEDRGVVREG